MRQDAACVGDGDAARRVDGGHDAFGRAVRILHARPVAGRLEEKHRRLDGLVFRAFQDFERHDRLLTLARGKAAPCL
jgi:hypothetical protein